MLALWIKELQLWNNNNNNKNKKQDLKKDFTQTNFIIIVDNGWHLNPLKSKSKAIWSKQPC